MLRGISFAVGAGRLITLLGPNGAGKSTLLTILGGGLKPSAGRAEIGGYPAGSAAALAQTGLLGHQSRLHPTLTVRENLTYYATLYGLADPNPCIEAALEQADATGFARRRVGELSQGMRQRAALARALLHRPFLLLLDEPFASLDRATVASMRTCLLALRNAGTTLIVSTHTGELDESVVDGSLHLERGRLVAAIGAAAEVGAPA